MDADLCSTLRIGAGDLCPGWGVCPPPMLGIGEGGGHPLHHRGMGKKFNLPKKSCIFVHIYETRDNQAKYLGDIRYVVPNQFIGGHVPRPPPSFGT